MFKTILLNPLFNTLIVLYNTVAFNDLGIAIILFTLLIRLILFPLFYKSTRNQLLMQRIQPEISKIQHTHKDNKEKQAQAMMELYKKHDVNPFSGFLVLLLQLPVLIAIYQVFLGGFSTEWLDSLYGFVVRPEHLNTTLFGVIHLDQKNIVIVILAAVMQYIQGYHALPKIEKGQVLSQAEKMGRQMMYFSPILTVLILSGLPAAIGLYWFVTALFSWWQQIYINKQINIEKETWNSLNK